MKSKLNKPYLETYNIIKILLMLTPFILVLNISKNLDNDTYWIIKTGEYICNNGIPHKDFLTMHTDMDLVCQQWLSSIIFYKLYNWFGTLGPIILAAIMYFIIILLMLKLLSFITNNKAVKYIVAILATSCLQPFIVTRPQIFTYAIILIELICLEGYVKKGSIKYLFPLPLLSVLMVNLHASMWIMPFIILLPYIANALPLKVFNKSIKCCKLLPLLFTVIIMITTGLATPYGIKGMSFIFTSSVGNKVNSSIDELNPVSLSFGNIKYAAYIIIALIFYAYYLKFSKREAPVRYHLLLLGTMAMGLAYKKLFAYFIIAGFVFSASLISDFKFRIVKKFESKKFSLVVGGEIILVIIILLSLNIFLYNTDIIKVSSDDSSNTTKTELLEEAVNVLDKEDKNSMVLFNDFNTGGYLEFNGYTTYIDQRADSFVLEANHDFDYLTESENIRTGKIYYKEFIDKYNFTHFIIEKRISPYLNTCLKNDSDYELLFENKEYAVYKVK